MAPLVILVTSWAAFLTLGRLGVKGLDSAAKAGRAALAVMFVFTGATHFSSMKADYIAMMPGFLPRHLGFIYATGVLEIAGGLGLLVPASRRHAGIFLVLLLLAMFPANVSAALNGTPFRGEPPMSLWLRAPIQLVFILGIWWAALRSPQPSSASIASSAPGLRRE